MPLDNIVQTAIMSVQIVYVLCYTISGVCTMDSKNKKERLQIRGRGRYGEPTVLRRVPMSVVPLLDCLLDKMARAAANDPRKTLQKVADTVVKLAEEERERDKKAQEKVNKFINNSSQVNIDFDC